MGPGIDHLVRAGTFALVLAPLNPIEPTLPSGCSLSFSPSAYSFVAPSVPWNGKRVYLWPGFGGNNTQWAAAPFSTLISDLTGAGYQIVEIEPPVPAQPCFFTNGGWQYREQFVKQTDAVMSAVEAANGLATENIAGGISWGGLHAMEAYASIGRFRLWFAHEPVTRMDQLTALAGVGDVPRFNPYGDVPSLAKSTGWISYATADTTTNYILTQELAAMFSPSVTVAVYPGEDHSTTAQNVADMFAWVQSH